MTSSGKVSFADEQVLITEISVCPVYGPGASSAGEWMLVGFDSLFIYLCRFGDSSFHCNLNSLVDLRKVIDFQFCLAFSYKDGNSDFQVVHMLELKSREACFQVNPHGS